MTKKFVYYQEDDMFIGWLEEFPDYRTQGRSLDELMDNLKDIYSDLISGSVPNVHKVGELLSLTRIYAPPVTTIYDPPGTGH